MTEKNGSGSVGPGDGDLEKVPLGDIPDYEPGARTYVGGGTRLTLGSIVVLADGGEARGMGRYVQYVGVIENKKTGNFILEPTPDSDPHKLPLTMMEGGHQASVGLRKLLKAKGIKIPRKHSMYIPCGRVDLADGPALELKFSERRIEPIQSHTASPSQQAAAARMPESAAPGAAAAPPAPPAGPAGQGAPGEMK